MNAEVDLLGQLDTDAAQAGVPPGGGGEATASNVHSTGIQKVRYSHENMINLLIARQGKISQNELGRIFDRSPSWISQIMSSDVFQARLMERTKELVDPSIQKEVERSLQGALDRSLELLHARLNQAADQIPDNLILRSIELSSRALGYGIREQNVAVQINMTDHLDKLGDNLVRLLERKKAEAQPPIEALPQPTGASP